MLQLINHISFLKTPWDSLTEQERKLFNPFILNRILTQDKTYINYIAVLQNYAFLEKHIVYQFYLDILPKKRMNFKFIDIRKQKSKINPDLIKFLKEIFQESERNVLHYHSVLNKEDLKKLLRSYGKQENEITRLLK